MEDEELLQKARQILAKRRVQRIHNAQPDDRSDRLPAKTAELSKGLKKLSTILNRLSERDQQATMLSLAEELNSLVFALQTGCRRNRYRAKGSRRHGKPRYEIVPGRH